MFWRTRKADWLIDPSKVVLDGVAESCDRNLTRAPILEQRDW